MSPWEQHGSRLYMLLLHANFLGEPEEHRRVFAGRFLDAATALSDREIRLWINGAWRERLTASWIAAARRLGAVRGPITEKLLRSETCYAGQGLCIATARHEDPKAAEALVRYLRFYLPIGDRHYDQEWAIGALLWLDARLGTAHARPFLDDPSLWKIVVHGRDVGALDPHRHVDRITRAMTFLDHLGTGDLP